MSDMSKISIGVASISVAGSDVGFTSGGVRHSSSRSYAETTYDSFGTVVTVSQLKDTSHQIQFSVMQSQASLIANLFGISASGVTVEVNETLGASQILQDVTIATKDGLLTMDFSKMRCESISATMTPDSAVLWAIVLTGKTSAGCALTVTTT